ncbi:MAG: 2-polyprenyl-6-methoxyphenol hydroxylase-like oxidoreductase [Mastigocoleus sp. MO_167.B18]|uniref:FAD-dependent oxidoreductase n=1 Tax=Mastigocoleus sp. MO_188.B34 TaxID=3036635 RepID=UPI002634C3D3|nr:FAD-dependent monooxygenase [Mastigocoleus sp. MO_188.B34]MDJ0695905.1 2-polyprenyl-6-methoxyphenol hydroxylase-like oxidoreductase [Mastigocoleus sp. MO_188.B34]MDJ0772628.1 2-polyprenyl-6-methoxyphenol hydroxylase-like oxidoreductase [Mastigocoleus sp. MO_167.B18]
MHTSISQQNINDRTAIVIGSSMAGLLSARVLADYFARVIVVERDTLPQEPQTRTGVPQANHVHVLLTQGKRILEKLFPGIDSEIKEAGAPKIDWAKEYALFGFWGWHPHIESNLITHTCSRAFLEWLVHRRLLSFDNIKFLEKTQVRGLLSDESNSQVKGVKVYYLDRNKEEKLSADLVVDASGRNSQARNWLKSMGYQTPEKTEINSFLGYSTRWYERPQNLEVSWQALGVLSKPPYDKRGGVLVPAEGNRWAVTLAGIARDYPPTNDEGFIEYARTLRNSAIYDLIKDAKPISKVYGYRRTENCWYHYEKLTRLPDALVTIGDAVCAFNPIYGQGMTTAALGALTLQKCLQKQLSRSEYTLKGLTKKFQKQLAQVLKTPWLMATSDDCRWESTEGGKPDRMTRFMHKYMDEVILLSTRQPKLHRTFFEVIHMIKPPAALFAPGIILGVLGQIISRKINGNSPETLPTSTEVLS